MTSTTLASYYERNIALEGEKQLACAILLQAISDLTTVRFQDDAREFLFSDNPEHVAGRSYWLAFGWP
jgi:hypothetical protein